MAWLHLQWATGHPATAWQTSRETGYSNAEWTGVRCSTKEDPFLVDTPLKGLKWCSPLPAVCDCQTVVHLQYQSVHLPIVHLSIYPSRYPSINLSIYLSIRSIHLSIYPAIYLSIYPSIPLSIYSGMILSWCPSIQISISVYICIYPSMYAVIHPSIHPYIYLSYPVSSYLPCLILCSHILSSFVFSHLLLILSSYPILSHL
jgi:hypothetical protein